MPQFFTRAERDALAKSGEARPDGSYPIRNAAELENAHKDFVRTGRDPQVAAWIGARAKTLGLPSPFTSSGDEMSAARRYKR